MTKTEFDKFFEETRGKGWAQSPEELWLLVQKVQELKAQTIVEIGIESGKTLRTWRRAAPKALILGMDLDGASDQWESANRIIRGDSHQEKTKTLLLDFLGEREIDFLFIDGDHSYEGVKQDWEMYSPLVRIGGLIAFHDLRIDEINNFFSTIRKPKWTADYGFGIGMVLNTTKDKKCCGG